LIQRQRLAALDRGRKLCMPLAGSPLINHGGPACSLTDQIYAPRPDACDIGAIEFGGLLPRLFVPLILK
jgi:hypothetical protein